MAVVLNATWTVKPGEEARVRELLGRLAVASRAEPGNLLYQAYVDPAEPRVLRIFEVYADAAAVEAHSASPHFRELALEGAVPLLEDRRRDFFETLD